MRIFELIPLFDNRKSFYGKARVIDHDNGIVELQSYDTIVCRIEFSYKEATGYKVTLNGLNEYSRTTDRHIKEFLKQYDAWEVK